MARKQEATNPESVPDARESSREMGRRVLYTLLEPAVRLAFTLGVSMKELIDWLQMAYYHETKRNGLKVMETARLLNVTPRTVTTLSQRLKMNFLCMSEENDLARRIEFVLWAGPLSEIRLCNALEDDPPEQVREVLAQLVANGRVVRENGRTVTFRIARHQVRLARDTLQARLDGLSNLLGSVANAVYGRFFKEEPLAFARTITLRVREQDLDRLGELYEKVLWERLVEIDRAAAEDPTAHTVDLSIVYAPADYIRRFWTRSTSGES
jgi:hypothetical protein